eukprot:TRINITY_DN1234_c1_g2_i1.p1 TRINITY_DN1234_c1_g2~~TRINITY_DN1234_c1_g2_i1.p1  ORF type:complete len:743 (+),score=193.26 TRINITY_DN1234_c1_g2_i1:133-2229(+)
MSQHDSEHEEPDGVALLRAERASTSFDVKSLKELLHGGPEGVQQYLKLSHMVGSDPIFSKRNVPFLSRTDRYVQALAKSKRFLDLVRMHSDLTEDDRRHIFALIDEELPISLHYAMFIPALESQASDEQKEKWLEPAKKFELLGTYAQTELGHGSFVRGLETIATFDQKRDEFVINSPSLTATKWWPGCLGKTSTHAVVMASLRVNDRNLGVHAFVVQLRSMDTHQPLPGIEVGDIGPKFGYNTNDNGFLRFTHHRIPRFNMLARYASLSREGVYQKPVHSKLAYATMVHVRAHIVIGSGRKLARAATIAIRYSCVRRQFPKPPDASGEIKGASGEEQPIINYQTQQHKLLPLLATAYAFHFTGNSMKQLYTELVSRINQGDTSLMAHVHCVSSGLKAICTEKTVGGIETCRRACGGHGYSQFSGFYELYQNWLPSVTYEGDTTILLQQTARYLVKAQTAILLAGSGSSVPTSERKAGVGYLYSDGAGESFGADTEADLKATTTLDILLNAFRHRARSVIDKATRAVGQGVEQGLSRDIAWNRACVLLCKASEAHANLFVVERFVEAVRDERLTKGNPKLATVLRCLCELFAFSHMEESLSEFMNDGYLKPHQADLVRNRIVDLEGVLRTDAVALVDAWLFSDSFLNSALGRHDGRVYQSLYAWAQDEPLNRTQVAPGYNEYIRPIMGKAPLMSSAKM